MKKILLIDPNILYAKRVEQSLNQRLNPLAYIRSQTNFTDITDKTVLYIVHESFAEYWSKEERPQKIIWLKENPTWEEDTRNTLFRQSKLSAWQAKILAQVGNEEPADHDKSELTHAKLYLFYVFNQAYYLNYFTKFIQEQMYIGKDIFLLPIKPLYQWFYQAKFSQGSTLFEMLFQIERGIPLDGQVIGHIFEKQKSGIYIARPGIHSEDILQIEPKDLLCFIRLFRNFISTLSDTAIGMIDYQGLSFELLKNIAFLSDVCLFDVPEEKCFGAKIGKELIADFLAEKPNSTKFVPLSLKKNEAKHVNA